MLNVSAPARLHHNADGRAGTGASVTAGVQPDFEAKFAGRFDAWRRFRIPGMLDFRVDHGSAAEMETSRAGEINAAYERLLKSAVTYRFLMAS